MEQVTTATTSRSHRAAARRREPSMGVSEAFYLRRARRARVPSPRFDDVRQPRDTSVYDELVLSASAVMCLLAVMFQTHPDGALIVAANRDERFARPAEPVQVLRAAAPRVPGPTSRRRQRSKHPRRR